MFRRTYLVKPTLQIKYLLYGLAGVAVTGICVFMVLDISLLHSERLAQLSQSELESVQQALRVSFYWVLGILLVLVSMAALFLFHRLIGPVYAVEKVLRMVADGDLTVYMPLRRGDELRDMADAVEQLVGGIRRRVLRDKENAVSCQSDLKRLGEKNPGLKNELESVAVKLDRVGQEFRLG